LVVQEAFEIYAAENQQLEGRSYHEANRKMTYDVDAGVVLVQVDANHEHGGVGRRSRNDNFLGTALQVSAGPRGENQ